MPRQKPAIICAFGPNDKRLFITSEEKNRWTGSENMRDAKRYSSFRKAVNTSKRLAAVHPAADQNYWSYMAVELT